MREDGCYLTSDVFGLRLLKKLMVDVITATIERLTSVVTVPERMNRVEIPQ